MRTTVERHTITSGWCESAPLAKDVDGHHKRCHHVYTSQGKEYVCDCPCHYKKGPRKKDWHRRTV